MKKETKDLIISMIETWNMFNSQNRVDVHFDDSEFSPKRWSLDVSIKDVIKPDFVAFLLPALVAQECSWIIYAYGSNVIFHIL